MEPNDKTTVISSSLNCKSCGAILHFEPGTQHLKCDHCGSTNDINSASVIGDIEAYDYNEFVDSAQSLQDNDELQVAKCKNCGSETTLPKNITADKCPFCASPLILELDDSQQYLKPHYILPFVINEAAAKDNFTKWAKGLSFAPSDLVQKINSNTSSHLNGIYLPYWAFDADATTDYNGERGDYYYETETYTVEVDGEEEVRERQVRYTDWTFVTGEVFNSFENILIPASKTLTQDILNKVGTWDFNQLTAYNEMYLSGFRAENYQLNPQDGLEVAKNSMTPVIRRTILQDIEGDEQRIGNFSVELENVGIKYMLLPVWVSTYTYNNKIYQFTINACTGEVHGMRPKSAAKIAGLVILILLIIVALVYAFSHH